MEIPADIIWANTEINKAAYVRDADDSVDDWNGLAYFLEHGGDCEDFAKAKAALLWYTHDVKIVYGYTGSGQGHAVLKVDGKWWLDNRWDQVLTYGKDFRKNISQKDD